MVRDRDKEARTREVLGRMSTAVKQAESALVTRTAEVLSPFDLTVTQYTALLWLRCNPGSTNAQLARWCAISPQSTSTLVSVLEARGLVVRATRHKTLVSISLTSAGTRLLDRADRAVAVIERAYAALFTPDEADLLRQLLSRAREAMSAPLDEGARAAG